MGDRLMEACREAGEMLADPKTYPTLPAKALGDEAARTKFVTETEVEIDREVRASGCIASEAAKRARANATLNDKAQESLPGLPPNVAAGMAMRYYAGFLDMAKSLRYDENAPRGGKIVITSAMRDGYMKIVHDKAQRDAVYAAGARFGWWGIKRPDRTQDVYDNGITDFYKQEYMADYYRKYPTAGTPAPAAAAP
jgi:hypothetical protein